MTVRLHTPRLGGHVAAIPSKSEVHRLLIAAALSNRQATVICHGTSEDIEATVASLTALGAVIERNGDRFLVTPIDRCRPPCEPPVLPVGESGSTLRFLLPVAAVLSPVGAVFDMRGRLPERPLSPLAELLTEKGVRFCMLSSTRLFIQGTPTAGDYTISAATSSQFISGLLFALPLLSAPSTLTLIGRIESAPYIAMTLDTLARFSAPVEEETGCFRRLDDAVPPDRAPCFRIGGEGTPYTAPEEALVACGDWSNAAFFLAAGAVGQAPVTVTGLSRVTRQGDRAVLQLLRQMGACVSEQEDAVTVTPRPLRATTVDASQIPDLVPILAVCASVAEGDTHFINASRLRLKESDRIRSTAALLRAVGIRVTEAEDGLTVTGSGGAMHAPTASAAAYINAAGDHRIAMCAAVLSTVTSVPLTLTGAEAVRKSYPHFFRDFSSLITSGTLTEAD